MSRIIDIKVSAAFVVDWGFPTGSELGYGFRKGWVGRRDMVEIALAKHRAGLVVAREEEELALLLPVDFDRVDELAAELDSSGEPVEQRARFWLLVALAWLLDHRSEYGDPYRLIDMLYADFEYPAEVAPLSGLTSLEEGDAPGLEGILQRWQGSVERWRAEYRARTPQANNW